MLRHILASSLAVALLVGCQDKPAPAPAPKVEQKVDPAAEAKKQEELAIKEVEAVTNKIKELHPETSKFVTKVNRVDLGPPSNKVLFELITPESILYTDKDVSYMLVGSLFLGSGKEVQNFTMRQAAQEALAQAKEQYVSQTAGVSGAELFKSLPLDSGFNFTYGAGTNHIAVFEDPDCAFCQKLHKDLEEFGAELNMRVTVFPFVLESKHPNAVARAKAIMCTQDPAQAWKSWMLAAEGQEDLDALWTTWSATNAPSADCPQAVLVDGWQAAGRELKFSATPTIIFENGDTAEGALSKEDFQKMFELVKAYKETAATQTSAPAVQYSDVEPVAAPAAPSALNPAGLAPQKAPVTGQSCGDDTKPCPAPKQ